ncbi:MAG: hypothetical protein AABZ39_09305 [Spirochaetota bacterium]|mgnify:CR=1 FL=1
MHAISLRNIEPQLEKALKKKALSDKTSVNKVIIESLRKELLPSGKERRYDDLSALAGTWSDEDLEEFKSATADLNAIDKDLWK